MSSVTRADSPGLVASVGFLGNSLSLLAALLFHFGGFPAGASTIRHDRADEDYLNLALLHQYGAVGLLVNSWGYTGSAVLIAPDWVLTGAHMFSAASSATFTINGTGYTTSELFSHPDWNGNNVFAGYDFGLARLSTPVEGVVPAALYTGDLELGQVGTFVGYGMTGTGLTGYQPPPDNQKRAFQNMIDGDFGASSSVLLASDFDDPDSEADNEFGLPVPVDLEGMVAPGDSGGGVFITFGPDTYLAGVISFVASRDGQNNADYGDVAGIGRVSAVLPWISSISSIPEPSVGFLFVSGIAVLVFGWFRQRPRGTRY